MKKKRQHWFSNVKESHTRKSQRDIRQRSGFVVVIVVIIIMIMIMIVMIITTLNTLVG